MSRWNGDDDRTLLVGLTVERYEFSPDHERLTLYGTKDGAAKAYALDTEAECCSQTWIESVIEESALIGHTITAVEDLPLDGYEIPANGCKHTALGEDFYEDVMSFYGLAMTTERGRCVIDYRNSSNGYYGGWVNVHEVES